MFPDQRCAGRNYNGQRCCSPEAPCEYGEGDCDGPADGGLHDGHAGCRGELVCGSNNCKKFGHFYHAKDDCCDLAGAETEVTPAAPTSSWGGWSEFSECSAACGLGTKVRRRECRGAGCGHTQEVQERPCRGEQCGHPPPGAGHHHHHGDQHPGPGVHGQEANQYYHAADTAAPYDCASFDNFYYDYSNYINKCNWTW